MMVHGTGGMAEPGAKVSSPAARRRAVSFLALMLATGACSSATVNTDFDREANFSGYKTYAWRNGTPARNQLMDRRVVAAVDAQLRSKGLTPADSGTADLFVTYHAAVGQQLDVETVNYGSPYRCWGGCTQSTTVRPVKVGTLVVDLVDTKRNTLVWRGMASDAVSDDPEETAKEISDGVAKMFENFPPKA